MAYSYIIYTKCRTLFTLNYFDIFALNVDAFTVFDIYPLIRDYGSISLIVMLWLTIILNTLICQLIFRHILIQELSRLIPLKITIVLSVILETLYYYPYINTWWEFIPALILASSATYLYLKSNRNFMVSYFYQLAVILRICIFSCKIFQSIIHYPYTSKSTLKSQYHNSLLSVLYLDILSF